MEKLKTLVRPELRPDKYLQPDIAYPLVFQPDGTVLYDPDYLSESFALALVDEWLADQARGRLLTN